MTFAHQLGDAKAQGCLQADDAAGRLGEGALFFFLAVGGMVGGDDVDHAFF